MPGCACFIAQGTVLAPVGEVWLRVPQMVQLESQLLGEGWLLAARAILKSGALTTYEGETTRELGLVTLVVVHPSSDDPIIARLGDAEWLGWMHENFFLQKDVGNLVELARLQEHVARELSTSPGRLVVHAKSAHIYEPEWALMARLAGVAEVSA